MFWAPYSSGGGFGWMGWGWLGGVSHTCAHACACMHTHTCTCMCGKHDNFMQMATPIGGIHGNSLWCHMHICVDGCVCMHMHVHMCGGAPPHHPPPLSCPNQDNSILFEDLWFVETPPPMGGCVGGWVGSGQITNNWINLDLIEIIWFYLKIYDL